MSQIIKFRIGATNIIINEKSSLPKKTKNQIIKTLKLYLKKSNIVGEIKNCLILVLDKDKVPAHLYPSDSWGAHADTEGESGRIVIRIQGYIDYKNDLRVPAFNKMLKHEFRHIMDYILNEKIIVRKAVQTRRLNELVMTNKIRVQKTIRKDRTEKAEAWTIMRKVIFLFMERVFTEGLARYFEVRRVHNNKIFRHLYKKAMLEARILRDKLNMAITPLTIISTNQRVYEFGSFGGELDSIYPHAYTIGLHMIYTIKMHTSTRNINFLKMSVPSFFRRYEQACAVAGVKPVISYTRDGKGFFNYSHYLEAIWRGHKYRGN